MDISSWQLDPAWAYYPAALLLVVLSIAAWSTSLFTLPGNWMVVALAAGFAWLFPKEVDGHGLTWTAVGVALALAALGEVIEFAAGAAGAAKQGASKRSVIMSLVGADRGQYHRRYGWRAGARGGFVCDGPTGWRRGAHSQAPISAKPGRAAASRSGSPPGRGRSTARSGVPLEKLACGAVIVAIVAADAFFLAIRATAQSARQLHLFASEAANPTFGKEKSYATSHGIACA